jgi:dipeptide/tripeptide permease
MSNLAPPYFLSFLVVIATSWLADRTQQRGLTIIALSIIGGIGYLLLATAKPVGPRYLGVCLAAAGIFPAIANILPWVLSVLSLPTSPPQKGFRHAAHSEITVKG